MVLFVSISTISAADLNDFNSTDPVNTTLENAVNDSNGSTSIVNNSLSQPINKSKVVTVITAPNVKANYAKGAKLSIYLKDAKGNALSNKTVFISMSGISTVYKVTTNANGLAIFNFKKVPKTYNLVVSFKGDEDYLSSKVSSKIVISKAATSIVAPTVKSYLTQSTYLKITLKDSAGNLVSKRKVTVTVGRKTYKLTTDANGLAKLKFSNKIRNVKVSIKFKGDKYYFASSKSSKVIITKMPTTIVAPSIKFYSTQYGTFLITLKDKNGKGVKGKYVYAYISALKKTYKLKTNSSGVAKLKIGSIKTYSVAVKFKGDKKYISSSRSSKLNVIKVNVKFNDVINMAKLVKEYVAENKTIPSTVTVNNKSYTQYQVSYLMAYAIKNVNSKNKGDITLGVTSKPKSSYSRWLYKKFSKKYYLQLSNNVIKSFSKNYYAPSYDYMDGYKIPYIMYTNEFAKILTYYNLHKNLPTKQTFSSVDFIKYAPLEECTFYLTSDNIQSKTKDTKMLQELAKALQSKGFKTKIIGVGPNMHNIAYKYGCKGANSVLVCCFGGVDVGCIEEWTGDLGTSFISNSRGARVLSVWYSKSYGAASSIYSAIGQAWDADYGTPLSCPAEYMAANGIGYIQKGTINDVCASLTSASYDGLKLN